MAQKTLDEIVEYLSKLAKHNEIYFHPNSGNAGDSLIACATFQLFDEQNLKYRLYDAETFDPKGKTLIYGGGGNLIPNYDTARNFIEKYHKKVKKLVILPHTINGHETLLKILENNVDIICREEVSYAYVKCQAPGANVYLADDMAFSLNPARILNRQFSFSSCLFNKNLSVKRTLKVHLILSIAALKRAFYGKNHVVLNCFRRDSEGIMSKIPDNNIDISKKFKYGTATQEKAFFATYMVFRFMNNYNEINTDRLHLAIAGGLLGKKVNFYPNSYYKCEAVYNFSMKDRFPHINWRG